LLKIVACVRRSQGRGTRDNLDQLSGNTSLTGTIVLNSKLVNELTSVLGGVLHSSHTSRLLRRGVVKNSQPKVGSDVQLIESGVRGVLVRDLLVVELAIGHGGEETVTGHELNGTLVVGDGGDKLVVVNDNTVVVRGVRSDVVRDGHASGVVHGVSSVGDGLLDEVGKGTHEAGSALVADGHDLEFGAVLVADPGAELSKHDRVHTTTETLVRGNGHDESAGVGRQFRSTSLHVKISLEHHIDSTISEVFASLEAVQVTLHLGGSHKLHGLGNLTNVSD